MIEASYDTLMNQAGSTAHRYLADAINAIDQELGEGYAAKHPELMAAFIRTAATDFAAAAQAVALQDLGDKIAEGLERAADRVTGDSF
jgi:hypothetical protein